MFVLDGQTLSRDSHCIWIMETLSPGGKGRLTNKYETLSLSYSSSDLMNKERSLFEDRDLHVVPGKVPPSLSNTERDKKGQ